MPRQARSPKYILTLALVSASILISGSLLKPNKQPTDQPLTETELTRLQVLAQRGSLDNMAEFFAQLAGDVQRSVVRLPRADRSGVIWAPDLAVTAAGRGFDDYETFWAPNGQAISAEATVAAPSLPIAAMQTAGDVALPMAIRRPVEFLRPGTWILVLWRRETQEHAFAPANYLGTQEIRCWDSSFQEVVTTMALSDLMAGGGVFDLDGNLLGLVVSCNGRPTVLSNASVQAALDDGNSFAGRMATRYGMRIADLGDDEQAYHKRKDGAIVKEVWRGYGADRAGLLPGDLIVNLQGKPVRSVDELEVMVLPVAQEIFDLDVVRGGRALALKLRARPPSSPEARDDLHAGFKLSTPQEGYPIEFVMAGSPASRAGIQPGDRLLKIDYEDPANANAVRQAFSKSRTGPLHLVLERGDRRWAVLLE